MMIHSKYADLTGMCTAEVLLQQLVCQCCKFSLVTTQIRCFWNFVGFPFLVVITFWYGCVTGTTRILQKSNISKLNAIDSVAYLHQSPWHTDAFACFLSLSAQPILTYPFFAFQGVNAQPKIS